MSASSLGLPVFVKPARAGSSVGITKVARLGRPADAAIASCPSVDRKVLVEAAVVGREIECGVLEDPTAAGRGIAARGDPAVRGGHDWYDFDAKYLDDAVRVRHPGQLCRRADRPRCIGDAPVRAFTALDCAGPGPGRLLRARRRRELIVNEVNTMPGFTPISMFPRMWAASGVDYPQLVDRLIASALRRAR